MMSHNTQKYNKGELEFQCLFFVYPKALYNAVTEKTDNPKKKQYIPRWDMSVLIQNEHTCS